jgi:hypothetical protein
MITAVDLAVAFGLILIFFAFSLNFTLRYLADYQNSIATMDLKQSSWYVLDDLLSEGIPANWHLTNPEKIGLTTNLYKAAILVEEKDGIARINEPVNLSISFDENCQLLARNSSVIVYDSEGR